MRRLWRSGDETSATENFARGETRNGWPVPAVLYKVVHEYSLDGTKMAVRGQVVEMGGT
jgi:hypothetical protein